jgi:hypothetical protein
VGVDAAEVVGGPPGQGVVDSGIHSHQYLLAIIHHSRVEGAGVDYRRGRLVTAENDHEVARHRRLALFVKIDDAALTEPFERQFNHPDGAVDDD